MSKSIYGYDTLGKSLYNLRTTGYVEGPALNNFLDNFINGITPEGGSSGSGDQIFSVLSSDISNTNIINVIDELAIGSGNLLRIIPLNQQIINDAFTYGVMITTNLYSPQTGSALGYTSIKLDVPYVYNEPDHILVAINKEAPDNFLEVSNSKFRVTGPFTFIKSIKTSVKTPTVTLGYYDREESTFESSSTLEFKEYDKGIVMERVENDDRTLDGIKFSYMGYSQVLDRFVMYRDGQYTGTELYKYPKMDGTPSNETGILNEYNIDRNPATIGLPAGNSKLEVDTIYVNNITSSDHTNTSKLTLSSHDNMTISVNRAPGDTDPNKNFDLLFDVAGKIIVNSSGAGTIQSSTSDYRIQSETGTFINAYNSDNPNLMAVPVYIGYGSTISIDNYLKTTYISTGVSTRNIDTMVEIGGTFTASGGVGAGSKLLVDGTIIGNTDNDVYGIYSKPTIDVPAGNNFVNYVSNVTLQPPVLNIGSGSDVDTSATLHVIGATANATNNYSILSSQGDVRFLGSSTTGAYMGWSNDALNLFNSRLYIDSVLSFGIPGTNTNFYTLKREGVNGTNELFVDGISTRIELENDTSYTITGTIMACQGTDTCASYRVEYCLSIRNGVKKEKYQRLTVIVCDIDVSDNEIFDVIVGYSGNVTNFTNGDYITVTGTNTNNTNTNWLALLEVLVLKKP